MKLSPSSLGSTLPLTILSGEARPERSDGPPSNEVDSASPEPAKRRTLLVITASTASARAIQNALVPVPHQPPLRDTRNVSSPTFKTDDDQTIQAPLLTFARSIAGAEFCLTDGADPSCTTPNFDAVLWEFPQDDPDALVIAQSVATSAASIPVIAVLFQAPHSPPQADALSEAGTFAGLLSMIPIAELNATLLSELIGSPSELSSTSSESVDQLCKAIRTHAHDIRNPLNCIQMLVDLMRAHLKSSDPIPPTILDQLTCSVDRASAVVSNLSNIAQDRQHDLSADHGA
jgi:signal transduction histidine kinase